MYLKIYIFWVWFYIWYFWISFSCSLIYFLLEELEYELFQAFEKKEYIHMDDLPLLKNYICGNINSNYSPNRGYYNVSKLAIVWFWKQKHGLPTLFLVKERQSVTMNLLVFSKINNLKIVDSLTCFFRKKNGKQNVLIIFRLLEYSCSKKKFRKFGSRNTNILYFWCNKKWLDC